MATMADVLQEIVDEADERFVAMAEVRNLSAGAAYVRQALFSIEGHMDRGAVTQDEARVALLGLAEVLNKAKATEGRW